LDEAAEAEDKRVVIKDESELKKHVSPFQDPSIEEMYMYCTVKI
jgi:hypothetical protein